MFTKTDFRQVSCLLLMVVAFLFTSCNEDPIDPPEKPTLPTIKNKISEIYDLSDGGDVLCAKYFWNSNKLTKVDVYENDGSIAYTEKYTYNGDLLTKYEDGNITATLSYNNNQLSMIIIQDGIDYTMEYVVQERDGDQITKFAIRVYESDLSAKNTTKNRKNSFLRNSDTFRKKIAKKNSSKDESIEEGWLILQYSANNVVKETWGYYDEEDGDYEWDQIYTYDNKTNPFRNIFEGDISAPYFSENNNLSITEYDEFFGEDLFCTSTYEYENNLPVKQTTTYPWSDGDEIIITRFVYE